MRSETSIKLKNIKFLQLSSGELKVLNDIRESDSTEKTHRTLMAYRGQIAFFVRLAVFSPLVRAWCRKNLTSSWEQALKALSKRDKLNFQFKSQKNLPVFDFLGGLIFLNEASAYQEHSVPEITLLYIATDIFRSSQAAYLIAGRTLSTLRSTGDEKFIQPMTKILENISAIHGAPGYLIYSFFSYHVANFFLENANNAQAAGALHLCYRYLLTASKLEKHCLPELSNFSLGNGSSLIEKLSHNLKIDDSSNKIPFKQLIAFYKVHYSSVITSIEKAAEQTAANLAHQWCKKGS